MTVLAVHAMRAPAGLAIQALVVEVAVLACVNNDTTRTHRVVIVPPVNGATYESFLRIGYRNVFELFGDENTRRTGVCYQGLL